MSATDRKRLRAAVDDLDRAIQCGECQPRKWELLALATLCDRVGLGWQASRVRWWIDEGRYVSTRRRDARIKAAPDVSRRRFSRRHP